MPILTIIQPICYKASKFEKIIERKLLSYGIAFPNPETYCAKDLEAEGIFRTIEDKIEGKIIELRYQKYFGRSDFIKSLYRNHVSQIKHINERKLLEILNKNQIYRESLSFVCNYEGTTTKIDLTENGPDAIKHNKFKINFEESPKLLGEMLVTYFKAFNIKNTNPPEIFKKLEQIKDDNLIPYSLEEVNTITGTIFNKNDYIHMLVYYFVRRTKRTH